MSVRWISALFTAIPALVFSLYLLGSPRDEYFWTTNALTSFTYITASLFLGLALTPRLQHSRLGRPWMWIGLQGIIAWILTLRGSRTFLFRLLRSVLLHRVCSVSCCENSHHAVCGRE